MRPAGGTLRRAPPWVIRMDSRHQGPEERNHRRYQACAPESSALVTNGHIYPTATSASWGIAAGHNQAPRRRACGKVLPERIRIPPAVPGNPHAP